MAEKRQGQEGSFKVASDKLGNTSIHYRCGISDVRHATPSKRQKLDF